MKPGDVTYLNFEGRSNSYYKTVADAIDTGHLKYLPGKGFVIRSNRDIAKTTDSGSVIIKKGTDFVIKGFINTAGNDVELMKSSSNFGRFARIIGNDDNDSIREALKIAMDNESFRCDGCNSIRPRLDALIVEDPDGNALTFGMDCVGSVFDLQNPRLEMSQVFGILDNTYFLDDCCDIRDGSMRHEYCVRGREALDGQIKKSADLHAQTFIGMKIAIDRLRGCFYASGTDPNNLRLVVPIDSNDSYDPHALVITRKKDKNSNRICTDFKECNYRQAFCDCKLNVNSLDNLNVLSALSSAYFYDEDFRAVIDETALRLTPDILFAAQNIMNKADSDASYNSISVAAHRYLKNNSEGLKEYAKNVIQPFYFESTGFPFVASLGNNYEIGSSVLIKDRNQDTKNLFDALRGKDVFTRDMNGTDGIGRLYSDHVAICENGECKDVTLSGPQTVRIVARDKESSKFVFVTCSLSPYGNSVFRGGEYTARDFNSDWGDMADYYEVVEGTRVGICKIGNEYMLASNFELGDEQFDECRKGISIGGLDRYAGFHDVFSRLMPETTVRYRDHNITFDRLGSFIEDISDPVMQLRARQLYEVGSQMRKFVSDVRSDVVSFDIGKVMDVDQLHDVFEQAAKKTKFSYRSFLRRPIDDNMKSRSGLECCRIDTLYVPTGFENVRIGPDASGRNTLISIFDPNDNYNMGKVDIELRNINFKALARYRKTIDAGHDVYSLRLMDILRDTPGSHARVKGVTACAVLGSQCGMITPYDMNVSYDHKLSKWNISDKFEDMRLDQSFARTGILTFPGSDVSVPNYKSGKCTWFKDIQRHLNGAVDAVKFNADDVDYENVRFAYIYYFSKTSYDRARADRILSYEDNEVIKQIKAECKNNYDALVSALPVDVAKFITSPDAAEPIPDSYTSDAARLHVVDQIVRDEVNGSHEKLLVEAKDKTKDHVTSVIDKMSGRLDDETLRSLRDQLESIISEDSCDLELSTS